MKHTVKNKITAMLFFPILPCLPLHLLSLLKLLNIFYEIITNLYFYKFSKNPSFQLNFLQKIFDLLKLDFRRNYSKKGG